MEAEVDLSSLLPRFHLSLSSLEKKCSDNLFLILHTKINSFEDAVPYFGFTPPEIEELRRDVYSERRRKLEMLWRWKKKKGSDCTYLAMVKILLRMDDKELAEVVLKHFDKEEPSIESRLNPARSMKYPNWNSISKFEREKVQNNLYVENSEIRRKYAFLADDILESLEKRKIEVSRLKSFLVNYGAPQYKSTAALLSKIDSAVTLADVLLIVHASCSSWFNFQLFRDIVEKFGSDNDRRKIKTYEEDDLVPYLQRSIFEIPSMSFGSGDTTASIISLGLHLPDDVVPTGQDMVVTRANVSRLLGIPEGILQFIGYDESSKILVFTAPETLLDIAVEKYFTHDTEQNIYYFKDDLAQLLIPAVMSKPMEIPILGRSFQLGMLYDYRNDCLLPNVTTWPENTQNEVITKSDEDDSRPQFEIITDDISPAAKALGVEGSLKMSFLGGLIKECDVSGSAKYLYNYKSSKQAQVAIRYKYSSHRERVKHEQMPNVQSSVGTHIVTGISYGVEAIFLINQEVADDEKYHQVSKKLQQNADLLCNALNGHCNLEVPKLPMVDVMYFGDFPSQEKISTFQDVVKFCNNLLTEEENYIAIPKQAYLHPVSELNRSIFPDLDLCTISTGLVSKVENVTQCFHDIEFKCSSLKQTSVCKHFIGIQEQLSKFIVIVSKYKLNFMEQLGILLPKIRGRQAEEQELEKLCEKYFTSQLNGEGLSSWIEEKECEVRFIAECIEDLLQVPGIKLEFPSVIGFINRVIAFEFKAIGKNDQALEKLSARMHSEEQINKKNLEGTAQAPWYKSEAIKKNVTLKMRQFTSFAKANADDKSISFNVPDTSEDTHICDECVQIVSYTKGQPDDEHFEPPTSPYNLAPTSMQNSIELAWSKPQYGSMSVQSYTVFYSAKDDFKQEYKSQKTDGPKTTIKIADLVPNTYYILKVQANCTAGKSEASENANVKTLSGDDQQMEDDPAFKEIQRSISTPDVLSVTHQQIDLPTLGRPFQLGMLYDYCKDYPLSHKKVWHDDALTGFITKTAEVCSQFEIINDDSSPTKSLGVEGSLKLSFSGGLITKSEVSGSAKYLYSYKSSKQQARVAIRFKYISHTERVNHEKIPNDQYRISSKVDVGTHVVTGISYGAEAIFVIAQEVADCKNYQHIYEELQEEAAQFCNMLTKQCDIDLLQQLITEKSTVTYFIDVLPKTTTFQEVAKFCQALVRGENILNLVPKQVYLLPLSELNSGMFPHLDLCVISIGLVSQVENILQYLDDIEDRCNSLMKTNIYQYFTGFQKQLSMFNTFVSKYKPYLVKQLAILLPKIRGGQEKERELEKLCEKYQTSQFNCEVLSNWIKEKECEVNFITECLEELQQVLGVKLEFTSVIDPMNRIIAFELVKMSDSEEQLKISKDLVQIPWYKNEAIKENIKLKMSQLSNFVKSNANDESIRFIVTDTNENTLNYYKGVQIVSYINGQRNDQDFKLPNVHTSKAALPAPYQPKSVTITHNSIELTWNKPKPCDENVECYIVSCFCLDDDDDDDKCKQFETINDKNVIVISVLIQETNYRFNVKAQYKTGLSENSRKSKVIKTHPKVLVAGPPGKPSAVNTTSSSIDLKWKKPQKNPDNMDEYKVLYRLKDHNLEWQSQLTDGVVEDITINGLVPKKPYNFKVQCIYNNIEGEMSTVSEAISTKQILPSPGKPTASYKTHHSVELHWTEPQKHDSKNYDSLECYKVLYRALQDSHDIWKSCIIAGTKTNAMIYDLSPATKYIFKLQAGSSDQHFGKDSKESDVIMTNNIIPSCPGKPQCVRFSDSYVELQWTEPKEHAETVERYTVYYCCMDDGGHPWEEYKVGSTSKNVRVTELTPHTRYCFRIQAVSANVRSEKSEISDPIQTLVPVPGVPGQPEVVSRTHNSISLKWSKPAKFPQYVMSYYVHYCSQEEQSKKWLSRLVSGETETEVTGLSPKTTYLFKVQAVNNTGSSEESDVSMPICTLTILPSQPGEPKSVSISHDKITIEWAKPLLHAEHVQYYTIYYKVCKDKHGSTTAETENEEIIINNAGGIDAVHYKSKQTSDKHEWNTVKTDSKVEELLVSGLQPNTSYIFKVQAESVDGPSKESETSNVIQTLIPIPSKPGQPKKVSATYNSISLEWTEPTHYAEYVVNYCVSYSYQEDVKQILVNGEKTNVTITGLSPKTIYCFTVEAQSERGSSEVSEVDICTLPPIPSQPGQPQAVHIIHDQIIITWAKPQECAEHIMNYTVHYTKKSDNYEWRTVKTVKAVEVLEVNGLEPKTGYIFKVQAESVDGPSKESQTSNVIQTLIPIPSKPRQPKKVSATYNSISLEWTEPTHYAKYVVNYCVSYSYQEEQILVNGEKTNVTITGLSPKTIYCFTVEAQSERGSSEVSEVGICTLPPIPSQPGQPQAVHIIHDQITIAWAKPQECAEYIQNYTIYYRALDEQEWTTEKTNVEVLVISGLGPNKKYVFKVQAESADGPSEESGISNPIKIEAPVPSQPGKPTYKAKSHNCITLIWSKPNEYYENVECYKICYYDDKIGKTKVTNGRVEEIEINGLDPQKEYYFKVQAKSKFGDSLISLSSDLIGTNPLRPVLKIIPHCKKLQDSPTIRHLRMRNVLTKQNYAMLEYGEATDNTRKKVLMIVGATGSGKSTLINAMVNYLLGVEWDDVFRLKLIHEEVKSQTKSVTKRISAYTFHKQDDFPLPYSLTIVDTPGFGDPEGMVKDMQITSQIKEFFTKYIDHLDGIGFVTQAGRSRLTPTQIYIFNSIFSIFGKDVKDNIFTMVTFADGAYPLVIEAIKEQGIPCTQHCKFNNSALYSDEKKPIDKIFWDMGVESFSDFFDRFQKTQSVSLELTREVLNQREQLQTTITGLQQQIHNGMLKINSLERKLQILKRDEAKIKANERFEIEVEETEMVKVDLGLKKLVTNCLICNMTCHKDCTISDQGKKYQCAVMKPQNKQNAKCTVCPANCPWYSHENAQFFWDLRYTTKITCFEDMKEKYYDAVDGKTEVEIVIGKIGEKIHHHFQKMMQNIQTVHSCIKCLHEIALQHHPWSDVEYIDLLIESEKQEKKPGFEKRVHYYGEVRKQAELISRTKELPQQLSQEEGVKWWKQFLSLESESDELLNLLPPVQFNITPTTGVSD